MPRRRTSGGDSGLLQSDRGRLMCRLVSSSLHPTEVDKWRPSRMAGIPTSQQLDGKGDSLTAVCLNCLVFPFTEDFVVGVFCTTSTPLQPLPPPPTLPWTSPRLYILVIRNIYLPPHSVFLCLFRWLIIMERDLKGEEAEVEVREEGTPRQPVISPMPLRSSWEISQLCFLPPTKLIEIAYLSPYSYVTQWNSHMWCNFVVVSTAIDVHPFKADRSTAHIDDVCTSY